MARTNINNYKRKSLFCIWLTVTTAVIATEDLTQQRDSYYDIFEARIKRLEELLDLKTQQQDILEEKLSQLEILKFQVQQQELLINTLESEVKECSNSFSSNTKIDCHQPTNNQEQGIVVLNDLPASCADLQQLGHTLSGLYSVMGYSMVETVYCNFTKPPGDPDIQTWIGYTDVKSSPTYFYVQKNFDFDIKNIPIPFEVEKVNIGGAMNASSGIFTAPRTGIYSFFLSGMATIPSSTSRLFLGIGLYLNGFRIGSCWGDEISPGSQDETYSLQSTLNLGYLRGIKSG